MVYEFNVDGKECSIECDDKRDTTKTNKILSASGNIVNDKLIIDVVADVIFENLENYFENEDYALNLTACAATIKAIVTCNLDKPNETAITKIVKATITSINTKDEYNSITDPKILARANNLLNNLDFFEDEELAVASLANCSDGTWEIHVK